MKSAIFAMLALLALFSRAYAQYGIDIDAFVCAVNQFLATQGRPPLGYDLRLCNACAEHSADMAAYKYMGHNDHDGTTPWERLARLGVANVACAENVAEGYQDIPSVMDGWEGSTGHRNNLLGDYNVVCGAMVNGYWTQDFAQLPGSITYPNCGGGASPQPVAQAASPQIVPYPTSEPTVSPTDIAVTTAAYARPGQNAAWTRPHHYRHTKVVTVVETPDVEDISSEPCE